jgi:hypothetical protein
VLEAGLGWGGKDVGTLATSRWSKMSDCAKSFLKSAEPASTIPCTFTCKEPGAVWVKEATVEEMKG